MTVLAPLAAIVNRVAARSVDAPIDTADKTGGIAFRSVRAWVSTTLAEILVSGAAGSSGAAGYTSDSAFGAFVTAPDSWPLSVFAAATGDAHPGGGFQSRVPWRPGAVGGLPGAAGDSDVGSRARPGAGVQITLLVNEERVAAEVPTLTWSSALSSVATSYATEVATEWFFRHNSPTTGDVGDRLRTAGISYRTAGQNLAWGATVDRIHIGLMNSPTHRANILNPQ